MKKKISIIVIRNNNIDAWGAYRQKTMEMESPIVLLNIKAIFGTAQKYGADPKAMLISTLAHEFAHALEEYFGKKTNEKFITELGLKIQKDYYDRRGVKVKLKNLTTNKAGSLKS